MEPGESLPIMKLTRGAKRSAGLMCIGLGASVSFVAYKMSLRMLNETLESVGELLYRDLGVVLRKHR